MGGHAHPGDQTGTLPRQREANAQKVLVPGDPRETCNVRVVLPGHKAAEGETLDGVLNLTPTLLHLC